MKDYAEIKKQHPAGSDERSNQLEKIKKYARWIAYSRRSQRVAAEETAKELKRHVRFDHADASRHIANLLQAAWNAGVTDRAQVAYIIATADHESLMGKSMIESEKQAKAKGYDVKYRGRGYGHLTDEKETQSPRSNYTRFGRIFGVDLVNNPDLAAGETLAAKILVNMLTQSPARQVVRSGKREWKKLVDFGVKEGESAKTLAIGWVEARAMHNVMTAGERKDAVRIKDVAKKIFQELGGLYGKNDSPALIAVALILISCESHQAQSRPIDRKAPTAGLISSTIAKVPARTSSCTRPELAVTAQVPVVSLGSPPVQLSFAAPQFSGLDAPSLEHRLDTLAKQILANRQQEWKECPIVSPLHLECLQWKIATTCEVVEIGSVFSVVCTNRLSDEEPARPVVDYSVVHATRCGESLIFPSFEKELCPAWSCLDGLHETFLRNGLEDSPLLNESSRATFKSIMQQFYFTKTHIVFLLGEHASVRLRYDERFEYGYKVIPVTYADMLRASPRALDFLRTVGLVPSAANEKNVE